MFAHLCTYVCMLCWCAVHLYLNIIRIYVYIRTYVRTYVFTYVFEIHDEMYIRMYIKILKFGNFC